MNTLHSLSAVGNFGIYIHFENKIWCFFVSCCASHISTGLWQLAQHRHRSQEYTGRFTLLTVPRSSSPDLRDWKPQDLASASHEAEPHFRRCNGRHGMGLCDAVSRGAGRGEVSMGHQAWEVAHRHSPFISQPALTTGLQHSQVGSLGSPGCSPLFLGESLRCHLLRTWKHTDPVCLPRQRWGNAAPNAHLEAHQRPYRLYIASDHMWASGTNDSVKNLDHNSRRWRGPYWPTRKSNSAPPVSINTTEGCYLSLSYDCWTTNYGPSACNLLSQSVNNYRQYISSSKMAKLTKKALKKKTRRQSTSKQQNCGQPLHRSRFVTLELSSTLFLDPSPHQLPRADMISAAAETTAGASFSPCPANPDIWPHSSRPESTITRCVQPAHCVQRHEGSHSQHGTASKGNVTNSFHSWQLSLRQNCQPFLKLPCLCPLCHHPPLACAMLRLQLAESPLHPQGSHGAAVGGRVLQEALHRQCAGLRWESGSRPSRLCSSEPLGCRL